eukprot:8111816-Pyramimonas_sp.AAC.2
MVARVVMLSARGQLVYSGPASRLVEHLAQLGLSPPLYFCHPCDYVLELLGPDEVRRGALLAEGWEGSRAAAEEAT